MKIKRFTPAGILLFVGIFLNIVMLFVGYVFHMSQFVGLFAKWFTYAVICAFCVRNNDKRLEQYRLVKPGIIGVTVIILSAANAGLTLAGLYELIMFNPELLTAGEILFAKITLFACLWLISAVFAFWLINISVIVTEKLNKHKDMAAGQ